MTISDTDIDEIGQLADTLDNLLGAMNLPMPPVFHLKQLKESLPEVSAKLKSIVVRVSGANPWE